MNEIEERFGVPKDIQDYIYNLFLSYIVKKQGGYYGEKNYKLAQIILAMRMNGSLFVPIFHDSSDIFGESPYDREKMWIRIIGGEYDLFYETVKPPKEYNLNGIKFVV